jgi:hypothetical protein
LLLTALPALLYVALVVYSVIDCLQMPAAEIYRLSRGQWVAAILFIPLFGAITWMLAGRPNRGRHERARTVLERDDGYGWTAEGLAQYPIGPDDDPDFLAGLGRAQRLLTRQQEEDERLREARQRREDRESGSRDEPEGSGPERP